MAGDTRRKKTNRGELRRTEKDKDMLAEEARRTRLRLLTHKQWKKTTKELLGWVSENEGVNGKEV